MTAVGVFLAVVGLGWALAWWDVRRRQCASLRASELEGFHVKLGALETVVLDQVRKVDESWQTADKANVEVIRSLAKEFGSMKLAVGMSPGRRMAGVRERFAEAEAGRE